MDPVTLAQQVEARYKQYLQTTFYFRDAEFRASFESALNNGHLRNGPFLEATPVFQLGRTPHALFRELLQTEPEAGFLYALDGERPLYRHQEQSIRAVSTGFNIVVATGTGSGKTEAFLYPILLYLYREYLTGRLGPGVRALILYPMNALANDQRERLGAICKRLEEVKSAFNFTFGQYIGETPEDDRDNRRHAREVIERRLPGEMVLRSEMRAIPPHILMTNYSMLEYLLLRPDDSPLFDNGNAQQWTFLVLDEAHQYRGARGIEMAMLLRRLKQRLRDGGRKEEFQCIATSATLARDAQDCESAVAEFAFDLFGEPFDRKSIFFGEVESCPSAGEIELPGEAYLSLQAAILRGGSEVQGELSHWGSLLGVSISEQMETSRALGALLQQDKRSTRLRQLITGKPKSVEQVAREILSEVEDGKRLPVLCALVTLLTQSDDPVTCTPLLSARYHLFLRSLEGAFVSYWPQKKVLLDRQGTDGESRSFEVALCRECGQHYFVVRKLPQHFSTSRVAEPIRDTGDDSFGVTFLRPLESGTDWSEEDEETTNSKNIYKLCVRCGAIGLDGTGCTHTDILLVMREESQRDEDRADELIRCGNCGYNAAGRDPVREVVHGTDGPHAVIATTLYQNLPEDRKKILAFADGRQEAAFFAWYLEDSYRDIASRNLLLKVVRNIKPYPAEGVSLGSLADQANQEYRSAFRHRDSDDVMAIRKSIWRALYREFLTEEHRISLEGVGLMRWSVKLPDWFRPPNLFRQAPWLLSEQESRDLCILLLDTLRRDRAVELRFGENVSLIWDELNLSAKQIEYRLGSPGKQRNVRSWEGQNGKRARLLAKLLMSTSMEEQAAIDLAIEALKASWEAIHDNDQAHSQQDGLLIRVGDSFRLNPNWWRLHLIRSEQTLFHCDTCGSLHTMSIRGICPRWTCSGKLAEVRLGELSPNHYRTLYEDVLPSSLRVEEHTAQLDQEKAREYQRDFKAGRIHVLSCSTTFEVGVDLGDLNTVFLRNIPPEAFNYAQRVGRAGRRKGLSGFAITYCRRVPHDLYHFKEPERMLSGKVRPPVLRLCNEKIITRHIAAVSFSAFFRAYPERFQTVKCLFQDLTQPTASADLRTYLHRYKSEREQELRAIIPSAMWDSVGLTDSTWIDNVTGTSTKTAQGEAELVHSRFILAEDEIKSDYTEVIHFEESAISKRNYEAARWAQKRAHTIESEQTLSFLSRKAVIPKYGFPVDVVELDTQRAQQTHEAYEVSLQRDLSLAISEFAPTSKLVANKLEWSSYGLKRVAAKEWERWWYARCNIHNRFEHKPYQDDAEPPFERCCRNMMISQYIVPQFGFITDRSKPSPPKRRPVKVFTTRPYFAGFQEREAASLDYGVINVRRASPGTLVVLCEGRRSQGFRICNHCGAGFRDRCHEHKTPFGEPCRGSLTRQLSLGHEFVTDVLQIQFEKLDFLHNSSEASDFRAAEDPALKESEGSIWFAHALAYAIVEGAAEALEVPSTDLNATVRSINENGLLPPIVLYDNVPGGAGLVARLEDPTVMKMCLQIAHKRVSGICGCDKTTSCYGCLRSYRNQFAHAYLQRGPVYSFLEAILEHAH